MEQTNRTILFEEINPQKEDLLMLVGEQESRKSLSDEEIAQIHKKLEVTSFEEFIEKFSPSIHMLLDTEKRTVQFSQDHIGDGEEKIQLNTEDSLFSMLLYLMEAKQKKKYVLTGFSDLLCNLIPRENTSRFLDERNRILQEARKKKRSRKDLLKKGAAGLAENYDDGIFLLTVFLQDTCSLLTEMEKEGKADKGILDDKGKMQVRVIKKAARYRKAGLSFEQTDLTAYGQLIEQCLENAEEKKGLKNRKLLQDCLMLPVLMINRDFSAIQKQYREYCDLYIEVIKKFWVAAKPMMETMLGVREFFGRHQEEDGMPPVLVVGNFQIADLLNQKSREKLDIYLNSVNAKSFYRNTIWYAIIPNMVSEGEDGRQDIRERFKAKHEAYHYRRNEPEELVLLVELLAGYRIQSFISLSLTEENTFSSFAKNGIDRVNRAFAAFDKIEGKDYLIPCFPNFMVVSQEEACLSVGKELVYDDLTERITQKGEKYVWLDEIGIEASYVAAGLFAACQCPKYLKRFFKRGTNESLPGVAYRFSEKEHNLATVSGMLSETTEFPKQLLEEAAERSRGVLFGQKNEKMIVLTDRVFSYNKGNPLLISMIQTISYMERVIQYETQDFKKNLIHQFFQRRPGSVISQWYGNDRTTVNAILKEEEELEYKIEETDGQCTFIVRFRNNELIRRETVSIFKE